MTKADFILVLSSHNLKITPQRLSVYEAVTKLHHPYADEILKLVNTDHPGIAKGTVYNILELFCPKSIITKVKTDGDKMRYDAIVNLHHHLYDANSDQILDYEDEKINHILREYFKENGIPDFDIKEVKLQIFGNIINNKS